MTKTTKLTKAKVRQMRKSYATGRYSVRQLAEKFGVGKTTASDALSGRTWANIE